MGSSAGSNDTGYRINKIRGPFQKLYFASDATYAYVKEDGGKYDQRGKRKTWLI